jgi:hypothetical protein
MLVQSFLGLCVLSESLNMLQGSSHTEAYGDWDNRVSLDTSGTGGGSQFHGHMAPTTPDVCQYDKVTVLKIQSSPIGTYSVIMMR